MKALGTFLSESILSNPTQEFDAWADFIKGFEKACMKANSIRKFNTFVPMVSTPAACFPRDINVDDICKSLDFEGMQVLSNRLTPYVAIRKEPNGKIFSITFSGAQRGTPSVELRENAFLIDAQFGIVPLDANKWDMHNYTAYECPIEIIEILYKIGNKYHSKLLNKRNNDAWDDFINEFERICATGKSVRGRLKFPTKMDIDKLSKLIDFSILSFTKTNDESYFVMDISRSKVVNLYFNGGKKGTPFIDVSRTHVSADEKQDTNNPASNYGNAYGCPIEVIEKLYKVVEKYI